MHTSKITMTKLIKTMVNSYNNIQQYIHTHPKPLREPRWLSHKKNMMNGGQPHSSYNNPPLTLYVTQHKIYSEEKPENQQIHRIHRIQPETDTNNRDIITSTNNHQVSPKHHKRKIAQKKKQTKKRT